MTQINVICKLISKATLALAGFIVISMAWANTASAQLIDQRGGWQAQSQNRASVASMIYQVEKGTGNSTSGTTSTGDGVTQLVCGGGSSDGSNSGATGNSSCVIINNSAGAGVVLDQLSEGDQTATANATTAVATDADTAASLSDAFDDIAGQ